MARIAVKPGYGSRAAAARYIGRSPTYVNRLIADGTIPTYLINGRGHPVIRFADLDRLMVRVDDTPMAAERH